MAGSSSNLFSDEGLEEPAKDSSSISFPRLEPGPSPAAADESASPLDAPLEAIDASGSTPPGAGEPAISDSFQRALAAPAVADANPPAEASPEPRARRSAGSRWLVLLLATWAGAATLAAGWLWYHWPAPTSPLENLPDDGVLPARVVSPLEPLPPSAIVELGGVLRVGDLEVRPLGIERRPVRVKPEGLATDELLVLKLALKNLSQDQPLRPTDPAFFYPDPRKRLRGLPVFDETGFTYTFLHPEGKPSGLLVPFDLAYEQGLTIEGQDFEVLEPGQTGETIVVSGEGADEKLEREMIWRIKLRKGKTPDGRGVCTVVGVRFHKEDVAAPKS